jgi:endonuclease/exonuclease/phosphatase family metal-dependent hydrolase
MIFVKNILKYIFFLSFLTISCKEGLLEEPEKSDSTNSLSVSKNTLLIGAFNIQVYGISKSNKTDVMNKIAKILNRYDMVVIQEVRDLSGNSIDTLYDYVNDDSSNTRNYSKVVSNRLGSTSSKEQYLYLYNTDKLELKNCEHFVEASASDFEREPYICTFEIKRNNKKFTVIPLHAKPSAAVEEITNLDLVLNYFDNNIASGNVLIMGDLNASCSYVTSSELNTIPLYTRGDYNWYIGNDIKTNLARGSDCAYDRIIGKGSFLDSSYKSSGIYDYKTAFSLTHDEADDISDHYPVEILLEY